METATNFWDFIEMQGEKHLREKKPLEIIEEQDSFIYKEIINLKK